MMIQLSRVVGKRRPRHNSVLKGCIVSSSSWASQHARYINSRRWHYRWNSGSSSGSNNTTDNNVAERRTRKKKKLSSGVLHITSNHPKNTNPPYNTITSTNDNIKLLTRKQLLRLTPKQRSNLQKHRFQQHQNSMSYLQQARINVRSNLNYLSDTAGTNLKKNMATIQRLFRGEEEVVVQLSSSNKNQKQQHPLKSQQQQQQQQQEKEEVGLDWERLPSELKQNVQSNIVTLQNWLHKATDGMIPSPSLVNNEGTSTSSSSSNNSIATRVQQFHQAKQSSGLVMDRKWLAWNIALALSPGAMIGLYLYSMQDEMKEYYKKLEEQERARMLGPSLSSANVKGDESSSSSLQQQSSSNEEKKGMGISSAFVLEGGGVLDKVKMAVNDLFLGGVEQRVGKAARGDVIEEEEDDDDDTTKQQPPTTSASTPTQDGVKLNTSTAANQSPCESDDTLLDPTMKVLLQRIESLEKQLGIEENNKGSNRLIVSEQEQQQRQQREQREQQQHFDNYIKERTFRQSPMQNRRDSSLATKWSEEEQITKSSRQKEEAVDTSNNNDESESTNDERSSSSSITLWKFVQGVKSLLDKDVNSVQEMLRQKIGMLEDLLLTSKEDEGSDGVDEAKKDVEIAQEEEEVKTVDASEKVDDVPVVVEEAVTPSTAVEKTTLEEKEEVVVVEQAKDTQEKGFRAWISRLFRKQSGGQPEETKE